MSKRVTVLHLLKNMLLMLIVTVVLLSLATAILCNTRHLAGILLLTAGSGSCVPLITKTVLFRMSILRK